MAPPLLYGFAMQRFLFSLVITLAFLSLSLLSTRAWADDEAEPKIAVATDPIALLYGTYTGSITKVATPHTAVRLDGQISEPSQSLIDSGGWRVSLSFPIYFDRALHGPFVEPGLVVANRLTGYDVQDMGALGPLYIAQHEQTVGPQIFVGWQWLFHSGLHLAAAIGASRNVPASGYGAAFPLPESYLRVGYAF